MLKRTVTGALITALVYVIIYYSYIPVVLPCAAAILAAFAVYEIFKASEVLSNEALFIFSSMAAFLFIFLEIPNIERVLQISFLVAVVFFSLLMVSRNRVRLKNAPAALLVTSLVLLLIKTLVQLSTLPNGAYYLTFSVTICFVTDIGAFLIGKNFGRHKMSPNISPNKTIEGSISGIIFAMIILSSLGFILEKASLVNVNYPLLCVYTFFGALVCGFGDLAMSCVKRTCKIKDFGTVLPGHGGLLDRFDSHIFTVAYTFAFCSLTGGFLS